MQCMPEEAKRWLNGMAEDTTNSMTIKWGHNSLKLPSDTGQAKAERQKAKGTEIKVHDL